MFKSLLAAASAIALAATLTACSAEPDPASETPYAPTPTPVTSEGIVTSGGDATTAPTVRELPDNLTVEMVADGVRNLVQTWPEELSDDETVQILNDGCNGLDSTGTPDGGVQAIIAHDIPSGDAAFALIAAIMSYCPEYSALLGGG